MTEGYYKSRIEFDKVFVMLILDSPSVRFSTSRISRWGFSGLTSVFLGESSSIAF